MLCDSVQTHINGVGKMSLAIGLDKTVGGENG